MAWAASAVARSAAGVDLDVEVPVGGDLVGRRPHALGEAGQVGGAERRGLLEPGTGHRYLELVGLELEQQRHHRRAAVDPQRLDLVTRCGRHGVDDVAGLEDHRLDRGSGEVRSGRSRG